MGIASVTSCEDTAGLFGMTEANQASRADNKEIRRASVTCDRSLCRIWILVNDVQNCWASDKEWRGPIFLLKGSPDKPSWKDVWWARHKT